MITLQKLIDADIPKGDYAWAMKDIQNSATFLADQGIENFDNEDKEIANSYCSAFELMSLATKVNMKCEQSVKCDVCGEFKSCFDIGDGEHCDSFNLCSDCAKHAGESVRAK